MVGMAAVLAGSAKAPLTAIILLFELTQNYRIILPLMAAVGVSVWMVERMKSRQSLEDLKLQQMGVNLEKQEEQEFLQQITTALVMDRAYLGLSASMSLFEAGQIMCQNKCHAALVLNEMKELVGIISLADVKRQLVSCIKQSPTEPDQKLQEVCTTEVLYAHEDEPVTEVLGRMETRGLYLLPVVERDNPRQVLGIVERHRIGLAGDLAVTQKALYEIESG
jgi:CBS domain-containing protein